MRQQNNVYASPTSQTLAIEQFGGVDLHNSPSNVSEQFPHPVNAALKTRPEKKERNIPIKS